MVKGVTNILVGVLISCACLYFPDNVKLQPELFKKFIPGLMISTLPCQLSYLSSEAKVMSQNLRNAHTSQTLVWPLYLSQIYT